MSRTRARLAILAAIPLIAAFAASAFTGTAAAVPYTAPGGTYSVTSGQSHITLTIGSNPTHYNIRAKAVCTNGTFYGGWHTSGNTSATCATGGRIAAAYAQYDETHKYQILAWIPGDSLNGSW
jgi:hypothetical protein